MSADTSSKVLVALVIYFLFPNFHAYAEDEGCIKIKDCPAALKHVKNVKTHNQSMKVLLNAHCGFEGNEPIVKCSVIPDLPDSDSGGGSGCIRLQDCSKAVKMIQQRVLDPVVVNLFRSIHCGVENFHPLIYCHRLSLNN